MLEFLFRSFILILFVIVSFGVGPAVFSTSSFLAFLLVAISTHIQADDLSWYAWIIAYGIIADVIIGVNYGVHSALYLMCAILCLISSRKISPHHTTSKTSLAISSVLIVVIMTSLYEVVLSDMNAYISTWKNIFVIVLGTVVLYLPLRSTIILLEKIFQEFLSARDFKKHQ